MYSRKGLASLSPPIWLTHVVLGAWLLLCTTNQRRLSSLMLAVAYRLLFARVYLNRPRPGTDTLTRLWKSARRKSRKPNKALILMNVRGQPQTTFDSPQRSLQTWRLIRSLSTVLMDSIPLQWTNPQLHTSSSTHQTNRLIMEFRVPFLSTSPRQPKMRSLAQHIHPAHTLTLEDRSHTRA